MNLTTLRAMTLPPALSQARILHNEVGMLPLQLNIGVNISPKDYSPLLHATSRISLHPRAIPNSSFKILSTSDVQISPPLYTLKENFPILKFQISSYKSLRACLVNNFREIRSHLYVSQHENLHHRNNVHISGLQIR